VFKVGDQVRSKVDSKAMGAEWLAVIIEKVSEECFITAGRWFPYAKDDPRYDESAMLNPNTWADFDPADTTMSAMQLRAASLEHADQDSLVHIRSAIENVGGIEEEVWRAYQVEFNERSRGPAWVPEFRHGICVDEVYVEGTASFSRADCEDNLNRW
tara:strand:- start:353 stop:823 length:471 start_codon:yes stop_codon:yes gene_type:complete